MRSNQALYKAAESRDIAGAALAVGAAGAVGTVIFVLAKTVVSGACTPREIQIDS